MDVDRIKGAELTHAQIFDLLARLRRIQKIERFDLPTTGNKRYNERQNLESKIRFVNISSETTAGCQEILLVLKEKPVQLPESFLL